MGIVRCRWGGGAARFLMAAAAVGVPGGEIAALAHRGGLAATLSGLPSNPRSERSLAVRSDGVGIRFRAPASGGVTALHTFWRRPTAGCQVTLYDDARYPVGQGLASAPLPDGATGWVTASLGGRLAAGGAYHVLFTCDPSGGSRLGYVMQRHAGRGGAWQLEDVRRGRLHPRRLAAAPLFGLVFADGKWWGQPYRGLHHRPLLSLCGKREASLTLVPTKPVLMTGVQLPAGRAAKFTLTTGDGTPLLASRASNSARGLPHPGLPAGVTLAPGVPYTLRVASARGHRCLHTRALVTDLPLGPSLSGLDVAGVIVKHGRGRYWEEAPATTLPVRLLGTDAPLAGCGNGHLDPGEQCDGRAHGACPGRCTAICTCARPRTCGDGKLQKGEQCDGTSDGACPGRCTSSCTCAPSAPAGCGDGQLGPGEECDGGADAACPGQCTATCTCATVPATPYRSVYAAGYLGAYDSRTIPIWPQRLGLILGGADVQGPLVAPARRAADAAGNAEARFVFYFSLTSLDSGCGCSDSHFYDTIVASHPEWRLRDASGNLVSTFVDQLGTGRQIAIDIGNPGLVDAWVSWALAAVNRYGWDGVFADNVTRGIFYNWSAVPVNPRTGTQYTTAGYRRDLLAALQRIRAAFDARGKIFIGNHTGAWEAFDDPLIRQQMLAMHGLEIEGCFLTPDGFFAESDWISQTAYLAFANQHGVLTMCNGVGDTNGSVSRRTFLLASYMLTKEGLSNVAEVNTTGQWWGDLGLDLGAPTGHYACLDPGAGLAAASDCPSPGKIYVRDWERGLVLVNPTAGTTVTVPLGGTFRLNGSPVSSVTLGPQSAAVLVRP
jgi:hypothetical protein